MMTMEEVVKTLTDVRRMLWLEARHNGVSVVDAISSPAIEALDEATVAVKAMADLELKLACAEERIRALGGYNHVNE